MSRKLTLHLSYTNLPILLSLALFALLSCPELTTHRLTTTLQTQKIPAAQNQSYQRSLPSTQTLRRHRLHLIVTDRALIWVCPTDMVQLMAPEILEMRLLEYTNT